MTLSRLLRFIKCCCAIYVLEVDHDSACSQGCPEKCMSEC